ncbi:SGNH/GDSL hydrolase family protein [bacterium]|nr:SGNH/GDSL hydrolase family protein [bacterium]
MKYQSTIAVAIWLLLAGACHAQTQHWSNVAEQVSANMDTFRQLFQDAHTTGFGITILGDSQETAPGGGGQFYVPTLGDEFFQYYGNVPKSGLITGTSQDSAWLSAGASADVISVDSNYSLPSVTVGRYESTPSSSGLLAQVATDGYTTPYLNVPDSGYFNGHPLEAELILRTRPDSGEAFWRASLTDDDQRSYFNGEQIGSGVTNINAAQNQIEFVSANLGTFDLEDHKALQIVARSADDERSIDIVGVRYTNTVDQSGIALQSFSRGGYSAELLLDNHSDADSQFKLLAGEDVVAIQLGANDAAGGRSAADFKEDLRSIISRVRDWSDDESLPVILISDPDFENPIALTEERRAEFDLYPGVSAELATELENVLALNTRLIGARNNWFVGSSEFDLFTSDGIHYTQLGGSSLAQWQAASLLSLAEPVPVPEPNVLFAVPICLVVSSLRRRRAV